jgi:lysophospholipase L1-like esterase
MPDISLVPLRPDQVLRSGESSFEPERYTRKFLAQGDSWFSIGHVPPWSTGNLLEQMQLKYSSCAVNCARPGRQLSRMLDTTSQRDFLQLLRGRGGWQWDAILLSGGGNDLIDFMLIPPASTGPEGRLLLTPAERGGTNVPADQYISPAGWASFTQHLADVLDSLIVQRDRGANAGVPVILHTYDFMCPRPAPAARGMGPWLITAANMFQIPPADWTAAGEELLKQLRSALQAIVAARPTEALHLVDTLGTLTPAAPGTTGASGDWENEIHPTSAGYRLLAARWKPVIENLLP